MEIISSVTPGVVFEAVIFDFDGTLSLIREGWQDVMIPYFIEILEATPVGRNDPEIETCVRDFVDLLTGKQTIYQCIRLREEVEKRSGQPLDPLEYKHEYLSRLNFRIKNRLESLESGLEKPTDHLVPGSIELLEMLRNRGLKIYLASGTDEQFVLEEAALLGLDGYFDGGIFGAKDDYKLFSKEMIIRNIISTHSLEGPELLGFGDGYVEIQNVRDAGGYPIGVASNESDRSGKIDEWKRQRLLNAGATVIIPDYSDIDEIENLLF